MEKPAHDDEITKPRTRSSIHPELEVLEQVFPNDVARFEFLYQSLGILDSKASSLMSFNAIGLTALAVWLESIPPNWLHLTLDVVFLLLLISSAVCFWVVRVYWSPREHFRQPSLQGDTLLAMRDQRTARYRLSWFLSIVAVGIFGIVSSIHVLGTGLHAMQACQGWCEQFYSERVWGNRDLESPEGDEASSSDARD